VVTIVIPAVGIHEEVKRCVDAVFKHTDVPFICVLVVSGMDMGDLDLVPTLYANGVHFILSPRRLECAEATNIGFRYWMWHTKTPYGVYLASDTYVTDKWIKPIIKLHEQNPDFGWVSPASNNGPFHTGCAVFTQHAVAVVGFFDEQFKVAFIDDDYYWRFRKAGFKPHGCSVSYVEHPESQVTVRKVYGDKVEEQFRKDQKLFMAKWGRVGTNWNEIPTEAPR